MHFSINTYWTINGKFMWGEDCKLKCWQNGSRDGESYEMEKYTYISALHKFEIILFLEHRNWDKIVIDRNIFHWYLHGASHPVSFLCSYWGGDDVLQKIWTDFCAEVQIRKNIRLVDLLNSRLLLKHIYKVISFLTILKYITSFSV